jgi:5-oxoprolinase (ATP-hydrolysing)
MCTTTPDFPTYLESFLHRYRTEFGFVLHNRDVLVDDVRVRGIGKTAFEAEAESVVAPAEPPKPAETAQVYFDSCYIKTDVFKMEDLAPGIFIGLNTTFDQRLRLLDSSKEINPMICY